MENTKIQASVLDYAIERMALKAKKEYQERTGGYVGIEVKDKFAFDGSIYNSIADVFWEKSRHFDILVKSEIGDFKQTKCCNRF